MADLGVGSGRGGASAKLGDFTIQGVATRVTDDAPTDQDWGSHGAPPLGTIVIQGTHTLWVRLEGGWFGKLMEWDVVP